MFGIQAGFIVFLVVVVIFLLLTAPLWARLIRKSLDGARHQIAAAHGEIIKTPDVTTIDPVYDSVFKDNKEKE